MPDNKKPSYGGQAVIEGVMMRGRRFWALAVRRPDKKITTRVYKESSFMTKNKFLGFFFIRGMVALVENLMIGFKALSFSVGESTGEEIEFSKKEMVISLIIALIFTVGVFFVLPMFIGRTFTDRVENAFLYNLYEGLIRIGFFLVYILIVSLLKDIKRLFQYHGAEHKTIQAYESGVDLTVENVKKYSTQHVRCGTSFLLIVMFVAVFVFALLGKPPLYLRLISRIVLIPVIAGIAYELIRLAGRFSHKKIVYILFYPGLLLQKATTRQPDDNQIEVAIHSLKALIESEESGVIASKYISEQEPQKEKELTQDAGPS